MFLQGSLMHSTRFLMFIIHSCITEALEEVRVVFLKFLLMLDWILEHSLVERNVFNILVIYNCLFLSLPSVLLGGVLTT